MRSQFQHGAGAFLGPNIYINETWLSNDVLIIMLYVVVHELLAISIIDECAKSKICAIPNLYLLRKISIIIHPHQFLYLQFVTKDSVRQKRLVLRSLGFTALFVHAG